VTPRRWLVLLATVAMALLTARLGFWQLDRAAQKTALQAALDAQRAKPPLAETDLPKSAAAATAEQHRAVHVSGAWLADRTVYLENRQINGQPGFYALTPLLLAGSTGSTVLVQRGWLPRDQADRTRIAAPPPPAGSVQVQGRLALEASRLFEFDGAASGPIRQNLALDAYARETGLKLLPFVVVQEDGSVPLQDGLKRQWPQPATGVHKHHGYAFQWFALCALVLGLYVWFQLIRPRLASQRRQDHAAR
jgi:surfeit locus 1 family protein